MELSDCRDKWFFDEKYDCWCLEDVLYTKLKLKMYQIWDGFCAVAKLNGGRRSSATLTGMKQRHGVKDAQR